MEIRTLQDYLLITELHSYLTALGAAAAFGLFWYYLNRKPGDRKADQLTSSVESGKFRSKG